MLLRQLRREEKGSERNIGIRGREGGQWLATGRREVRFRSACHAGRQRAGARALGLFDDLERTQATRFAAVPLHMTISDLVMFLVIFAGFGLCLAYFGAGFRAIRAARRRR
jgi:hypothetical protein